MRTISDWAIEVDGHDLAAFRGDDLAVGGGGEGHDPVADAVVAAAGRDEFGAGEAAVEGEAVAGEAVEGVHVRPPPGVHGRVPAGADVGVPGVHRRLQGFVGVRGDPDPVVVGVPGDGVGDLPAAELAQCFPLAGVVLADVLGQDVDDAVVAVEQGPEGAAGADRAELAVVADQDHLGLGQVAGGQEAEHVAVVGHAGLVEHDHVPSG